MFMCCQIEVRRRKWMSLRFVFNKIHIDLFYQDESLMSQFPLSLIAVIRYIQVISVFQ